MSYPVKNGQTSVVLRFKLLDSSSTTGAGLAGLTSGSSALIISTIADNEATATAYTQAGSTIESITTLGTYATPTATKCRFKEVDATNHKGVYEFQIADARFAVSSAKSLLISVAGATNLAQADFVLALVSDDPYVAKPANSNLLSIDGSGRVDVIKINGTSQTARDIGASVLLSSGAGTGQLDFTSGVVKASLVQILGTALTETSGQIAAAFKKFFDKASPTGTINSIPDAVAGATGGLFIAGTNAATTVTTSLTTTFTGNLTGSVASVTGAVGSVTGAVGSVTGAVGSVTGAVGSVATGGIAAASFAAGAIDATAIATDAIGSAELSAAAANKIADALLDRDMSTGTDSGSTTVRTTRQALRFLRNKWAIAAGTLTVYKEDDSTSSWTASVTTDGTALPIITNDPAGP